jgi:hypothetical protein
VKLSEVIYAVRWYVRSGYHGLITNAPIGGLKDAYRSRIVVQAGPAWAYRRRSFKPHHFDCPKAVRDYALSGCEPIEGMWAEVTEEIEALVNEGRAEKDRLSLTHPHANDVLTCRVCGKDFVGHALRRYCPGCLQAPGVPRGASRGPEVTRPPPAAGGRARGPVWAGPLPHPTPCRRPVLSLK